MRLGSWRDIPRGEWWASAIGVGFVLAQYVEQWWSTDSWGSTNLYP